MGECTDGWWDGWMDDWMHGWVNVCISCLLVVAWAYGRLIHARGPTAYRLTGFTPRQRTSRSTTNKKSTHTLNQPCIQSSIHPLHPSICIHPPVHQFKHPCIYPSSHPPILPSTHMQQYPTRQRAESSSPTTGVVAIETQ